MVTMSQWGGATSCQNQHTNLEVRNGEQPEGDESLEHFYEGLQKFTSFRELATLTYGEQTNNCCIVSSIEFDRAGECFAVAGVTKKIKVWHEQPLATYLLLDKQHEYVSSDHSESSFLTRIETRAHKRVINVHALTGSCDKFPIPFSV